MGTAAGSATARSGCSRCATVESSGRPSGTTSNRSADSSVEPNPAKERPMIARIQRPLFAVTIGAALLLGACSGSAPAVPPATGQQAPAGTSQDPNGGAPASTSAGSGDADACTSVVTKDAVGVA